MKIAVCISGAARSGLGNRDLNLNYERLQHCFPTADFYYGTWKKYENVVKKSDVLIFDEPEIHYHPFIDVDFEHSTPKFEKMIRQASTNDKFKETSSHQTKQILAHAYMMDRIDEYDVIVRARHDTITYKNANFMPYIEDAFNNNRAIGFATLNPSTDSFTIVREQRNNDYHNNFLFDQLIIHPKKILDTAMVYNLHESKQLVAAEHGWWQVLSSSNNHRCIAGWANPDKSVNTKYL